LRPDLAAELVNRPVSVILLALLWQILVMDSRSGIPKSVFL
jgi:hypothetical protein